MHRFTLRSAIVGTTIASLLAVGSQGAAATTAPPVPNPPSAAMSSNDPDFEELPAEPVLDPLDLSDLDLDTEVFDVFIAGTQAPPVTDRTARTIAPMATWYACGVNDSNTKMVRGFQRVAGAGLPAGKADLKCGSPGWGYRHILIEHRTQWEQLAVITGSDWRTFSDWAMNQALNYPAHVSYRSSNDTYLYKTQVQIRDSGGTVRSVKYINVSVARVTKNIITAFPTNT